MLVCCGVNGFLLADLLNLPLELDFWLLVFLLLMVDVSP